MESENKYNHQTKLSKLFWLSNLESSELNCSTKRIIASFPSSLKNELKASSHAFSQIGGIQIEK